jgi:NAD+ diphosphatase
MIAFTARYASGRIKADDDEIETLGWFGPSELPEMLPGRYSVARRLIEWFVREQT